MEKVKICNIQSKIIYEHAQKDWNVQQLSQILTECAMK